MRKSDEEVLPEATMRAKLVEYIGDDFTLKITPRKGRSEKITLIFNDGADFSIVHRSRKPGLARLGMLQFVEFAGEALRKLPMPHMVCEVHHGKAQPREVDDDD